jgi:hypothetical protein
MEDTNNIQLRSDRWEKWHTTGVDPNIVVSIDNQRLQFELISKTTNVGNIVSYDIIEIGPFNGMLCKQLLLVYGNNINSYTIVDDTKMLTLCRNNLKEFTQVHYCTIDDIHTLTNIKYNLFISNHCLSETTISYQNYIFDTFFKNCQEVFILDTVNKSAQFFDSDIIKYEYIERMCDVLKRLNYHIRISDGHKLSRSHQKLIYSYVQA